MGLYLFEIFFRFRVLGLFSFFFRSFRFFRVMVFSWEGSEVFNEGLLLVSFVRRYFGVYFSVFWVNEGC